MTATERVHVTLERLCNLLRVEAREHGAAAGLLPVQIEALHYLAQCNRFSDNLQAVTEFLGQTKGTVSQTLKVLEKRGLIVKQPDQNDRRLVHHRITAGGRTVLAAIIPADFLLRSLGEAFPDGCEPLSEGLIRLLQAAQRARGAKSFGACRSCRYLEQGAEGQRCGLTGEPLSAAETLLICREHSYPASAPASPLPVGG